MKSTDENFSDVINRIISNNSLLRLAGTLSDEEAKELKKHVKDINIRMRKEIEEQL